MATLVNVDNFVRAETARMFDNVAALAGGVNRWYHYREPTPLDRQPVIRMNRDTLYSGAIVDIGRGAEFTLPDSGNRYMTVMVVNEDHYDNAVLSGAGTHHLDPEEHGTRFVSLSIRTFVDPTNPDDLTEVNALQDAVTLSAASDGPYTHPEYDKATLDATREPLLKLAGGSPRHRRDVRKEGRCRSGSPPHRHRLRLGRPASHRGLLLHRSRTPTRRPLHPDVRRRAS